MVKLNLKLDWKNMAAERDVRLQKIKELTAAGVNCYPSIAHDPTIISIGAIRTKQDDIEKGQRTDDVFKIYGRIRQRREASNKLYFIDISDMTGRIQLFLDMKSLERIWHIVSQLDLGDIIIVTGKLGKTKVGELTLFCSGLQLISKAIFNPPQIQEKVGQDDAFADPELKLRKRYLDLMMNQDTRDRFIVRSKIVKSIRDVLTDMMGFFEFETPILQTRFGGAKAKPFQTHHNALDIDLFLRIAPELYLKRLLVGGYEKVFELNRNFRNEGIDSRHNPEFTMLEVYRINSNYSYMMTLLDELIRAACQVANIPNLEVTYNNHKLDFGRIMPLSFVESFELFTNIKWDNTDTINEMWVKLKGAIIPLGVPLIIRKCDLWDELVQPKLIQPTFITDFPTAISPLAKAKADNPEFCERFELYAAGMELANGFSELNDPQEQLLRFKQQLDNVDDEIDREIDNDYIEALSYGMPPASGLGLGIDRLVMLLTNSPSIKSVITFPTMKPEKE